MSPLPQLSHGVHLAAIFNFFWFLRGYMPVDVVCHLMQWNANNFGPSIQCKASVVMPTSCLYMTPYKLDLWPHYFEYLISTSTLHGELPYEVWWRSIDSLVRYRAKFFIHDPIWPWHSTPLPWIASEFTYPLWWVTCQVWGRSINVLGRYHTHKFFIPDPIWPWPLTLWPWTTHQFI